MSYTTVLFWVELMWCFSDAPVQLALLLNSYVYMMLPENTGHFWSNKPSLWLYSSNSQNTKLKKESCSRARTNSRAARIPDIQFQHHYFCTIIDGMSSESGTFTIIPQPPKGRSTCQPSTKNGHENSRHAVCQVCSLAREPNQNSATCSSSSPNNSEDRKLPLTEQKDHRISWASSLSRRPAAIGLEASFVDVPHLSRGDCKIDSIINMALNSTYAETNENQGIKEVGDSSMDIYETIRRTDLLLNSAQSILSGLGEEKGAQQNFLCSSCINR